MMYYCHNEDHYEHVKLRPLAGCGTDRDYFVI